MYIYRTIQLMIRMESGLRESREMDVCHRNCVALDLGVHIRPSDTVVTNK